MPSVFGIDTPNEAWAHVHHRIGNVFMEIQGWSDLPEGEGVNEDQRFNAIVSARIDLVGTLYVLVRRMHGCRFAEDAAKIQQLLDMVVEQDVTDPAVREAIRAKHREFDPSVSDFAEQLRVLREQHKR